MTKKDYINIANGLKKSLALVDKDTQSGFEMAAVAVASALSEDNPRFDEVLFVDYVYGKCGLNGKKTK